MPATIKINPERTEFECLIDGEIIASGDLPESGLVVLDDGHIFVVSDEDLEDNTVFSLVPLATEFEENAELSDDEDDEDDESEDDEDEEENDD